MGDEGLICLPLMLCAPPFVPILPASGTVPGGLQIREHRRQSTQKGLAQFQITYQIAAVKYCGLASAAIASKNHSLREQFFQVLAVIDDAWRGPVAEDVRVAMGKYHDVSRSRNAIPFSQRSR